MKSSVIVFPGSNCDRDIAVALEKLQFKNSMVWHKETKLPKSDLIVVPGGFGKRGVEGMILAAEYARTNNIPYLGLCLGMQVMIIEWCRNVLNLFL